MDRRKIEQIRQKRIITMIGLEIYNDDPNDVFLSEVLKCIQEALSSKIKDGKWVQMNMDTKRNMGE